ncbi:hypothetical protein ACHAWX_005844 [Stephanocyclus meneghinianus]
MLSLSLQAARRSLRSKSTLLSPRTSRLTARSIPRPAVAALSSRQWYSTEKILKHRRRGLPDAAGLSATADKLPTTLYDPTMEKENCGVGLVASLKSIASRKVVEDADEMLVRMSHRGGVGCCPASGDGAGMLFGMPDAFLRAQAATLSIALPPRNEYAVGNVFFPPENPQVMQDCKSIMERLAKQRGLQVLGWRKVPVDNSMLGRDPLDSEPDTEQFFVGNTGPRKLSLRNFERELFRVRKMAEEEVAAMLGPESGFYINSLSSQTITYKGQLTPEQVSQYYLDIKDPTFISHLCLVHSRFSTNTFPSWERAQPIRMMCHNGEINTLRGNKNWMFSRGGLMASDYFGDDTNQLLPVTSDHMSDSGNFDSVLELMAKGSERSLPEAVMMMIPEAWQDNPNLSETKKAFYEYNSCLMEPWDGPAMVAFTDGRYIGATLDRNGLRPSRYYVTKDDHVVLSSEIGVIPELSDEDVKIKHRLEPGKMFLVDFETQRIVPDDEIKEQISSMRPYREWLDESMIDLEKWTEEAAIAKAPFDFSQTNRRLNAFGFTGEKLEMLLLPMGIGGKEALGSMGNDSALAVLSEKPRQINEYFKQLFAQVTNPPIDPIREEIVMSLVCPVGPEGNLLAVMSLVCPVGPEGNLLADPDKQHCKRLNVRHPVLTLDEMETLKSKIYVDNDGKKAFSSHVIDCTFPLGSGPDGMLQALERICDEAADAIQGIIGGSGAQAVILSDRLAGPDRMALPSLIAVGAVHQHLLRTKQRPKAAIFAEAGDCKEVHDFATIFGYGCDGVCPYMAYEALCKMNHDGLVEAKSKKEHTDEEIMRNYRKAVAKGLLKLHYRDGGEAHLNTPAGMANLQVAARTNSREAYKEFARLTNEQNMKVTLRGQLKFKFDPSRSVPLDEVEPAKEIVKRFATGAMSLGSISREAHETLAKAMNAIGGRSNTGEGGEDPARFLDNRRSSIKQVASGRFGVTSHYLANSDQIQIKMAQGAKPGEGGELPGFKVSEYIAENRHTTPGVGLISPPPHHDIYSIEDLAQLIHDLKNAQPKGEVSVKLVSEVGVGVVAAGVAKALADHITISGHDGGTGAAAWTGIKGAGLPWELGLAETQQTLVLNGLRDRVKLQTDGQLKTGRDVAIACLLGAEEFGFATGPLIAMGCIMMRKCHLNTCPVGIATQDEELRKKFAGQPEHVMNYLFLMAEEIREIMAKLGYRKMEDMIGQTQHLEMNRRGLHYKSRGLDLSPLLTPASELNPTAGIRNLTTQYHGLDKAMDNVLIEKAKDALENGTPVVFDKEINNLNRTCGTMLSYEISKRYGKEGLPDDTIQINLKGHAGQSFAFTLAKGVTMKVEGDANDYTGKGLSGGKIAVFPSQSVIDDGFVPENNVIVGNVCLYGATSGKAFFRGKAGERFCVRNSGALAVVEGTGDHCAEYMTGGDLVVLGETGRNFGAGMSGGIAYVYDPNGKFPERCNMGLVSLESIDTVEEKEKVYEFIQEHVAMTGSTVGQAMLENWESEHKKFVKVFPHDYKRVLEERAAANRSIAA